jgi:hypothetical protein
MPKQIKGRNPYAASLRTNGVYRPKVAKSVADRAKHRDGWERDAKYKVGVEDIDMDDIEEGFQHGDSVTFKGKEALVKTPHAPLGMVGITLDGKYALVPEDQLELVAESLARMIELSK